MEHCVNSYQFCFPNRQAKQLLTLLAKSHLSRLPEFHFQGKRQRRQRTQMRCPFYNYIGKYLAARRWFFIGATPSPCKTSPAYRLTRTGLAPNTGSTMTPRRHYLLPWRGGELAPFVSKLLSVVTFSGSLWQSITPQKRGQQKMNIWLVPKEWA